MDNNDTLQIFNQIEHEEEDNWSILDEIVLPEDVRQPGDIDTTQIMEKYGFKGYGRVKRFMDKAAASGKFLKLYVYDPKITRNRWVLRRIKDGVRDE